MYMLAPVELTSLLRRRIAKSVWRRVHMLSFPLFVSSTIHGLSAGTDAKTPMAFIGAGLVASAVVALVVLRREARQSARPVPPRRLPVRETASAR
jgi:sulfoxide reductase heme-binding subunit YedZ